MDPGTQIATEVLKGIETSTSYTPDVIKTG